MGHVRSKKYWNNNDVDQELPAVVNVPQNWHLRDQIQKVSPLY